MKLRLDIMLMERELADSREQAQRLIRAGMVRVNDQMASKPGHSFKDDVNITVIEKSKFVSRGGDKMEGAFKNFDIDVTDLNCIDIGASTGGFTDCLLQHGAKHVIALDVGHAQLHWKIRSHEQVTVIEHFNARNLTPADIEYQPEFAVIDVSFISLTNILPAVSTILKPGSPIISLIKPQFEAGREQVEKGGVVRDPEIRQATIDKVRTFGTESLSLKWIDCCTSPLKGPAGNVEFLAYWKSSE
ncbi:MAG: TlyA family RNA methyltransferase [Kiritimatiellae bacterium]|nr:TlyA family RNA methyltransferase [Kiritimatiellia bacterium]